MGNTPSMPQGCPGRTQMRKERVRKKHNKGKHPQSKFAGSKFGTPLDFTDDEEENAITPPGHPRASYTIAGLQLGAAVAMGTLSPHTLLSGLLSGLCVVRSIHIAKTRGTSQSSMTMLVGSALGGYVGVHSVYLQAPTATVDVVVATLASIAPLQVLVEEAGPKLKDWVSEQMQLEDMPTWRQQKRVLSKILEWCAADKAIWISAYILGATNTVVEQLIPYATSSYTARIMDPSNPLPTRNAFLGMTGIIFGSYVMTSIINVLSAESEQRFTNRIKKECMEKVMSQDTAFFENADSGWILAQLRGTAEVISIPDKLIPGLLVNAVSLCTASVILGRMDKILAAMCLMSVPVDMLFSYCYAGFQQRYALKMQQLQGKVSTEINEVVRNLKTCKMYSAEQSKLQHFWETATKMIRIRRKNSVVKALVGIIQTIIPHILSLATLSYSGYLVRMGRMTMADVLMVSMYQDALSEALTGIPSIFMGYGAVMAQNRKVFELLERRPKCTPKGDLAPARLEGLIEFKNVCFGYRVKKKIEDSDFTLEELMKHRKDIRMKKLARRAANVQGEFGDPLEDLNDWMEEEVTVPVLEDFSLTIRPGERVALVGKSGCGKSTLGNLLLGMYEPDFGHVLVDGRPIHEYSAKWWYTHGISVVNQQPALLNASFEENITIGLQDREYTLEQLEEVCKKANAHNFIAESVDGYHTKVGREGEKISGGQRQRVAIARALLRDPSILILDEATSALDARAEAEVQEAINGAMEGRTVLMIAHRLCAIKSADRIVVLDEGKIVEEGTHQELLDLNGTYAKLVESQLIDQTGQDYNSESPRVERTGWTPR